MRARSMPASSLLAPVPPMPPDLLIEQGDDECVHNESARTDGNARKMRVEASAGTMRRFQEHGRNITLGAGPTGQSQTITKADRLGSCAASGDLAKVKKLLKGGVDPNYANTSVGAPAICIAAEFESKPHVEIVKELLKAKADVDGSGYEGITALMMAVQYDRQPTVKILLAHKANVDLRCTGWPTPPRDASPVDIAARHNRHEVLSMLLVAGAVVDGTSSRGVTALMCAAKNASVESVKVLLAHKADPLLRAKGIGSDCCSIQLAYESIEDHGELNPTLALLLEAGNAPEQMVIAAKEGIVAQNALGVNALFPDRASADRADQESADMAADGIARLLQDLVVEP